MEGFLVHLDVFEMSCLVGKLTKIMGFVVSEQRGIVTILSVPGVFENNGLLWFRFKPVPDPYVNLETCLPLPLKHALK